jgi:MYXO-CTERM domain-containing protein
VDENDDSGFNDWGLFGLLGLLGLAGLAKRGHRHNDDIRVRPASTSANDPDYVARR